MDERDALIWHGVVCEVWEDGDTFTAGLRREGCPDLVAEFSMRQCGVQVEAGDLFTLDGAADRFTKLDLGTWTQEEINDINRRPAERAALLREMCE